MGDYHEKICWDIHTLSKCLPSEISFQVFVQFQRENGIYNEEG